jgi:uncharacterized protein
MGDQAIFDRPAELIVLQPTTLCNLDCDYCFLPERRLKSTLTVERVAAIFRNLSSDHLINEDTSICWHLGEPLLMPIEFYEEAHSTIRSIFDFDIKFQFQTNGVHLNDRWCEFFRRERAQVGISMDGSSTEDNSRRRDWQGRSAFHKVLRGLVLLQQHQVEYHVICVLNDETIANAPRLYDEFESLGVQRLSFNVVESEGDKIPLFLTNDTVFSRLKVFYQELWTHAARKASPIWIREIAHAQGALLTSTNERVRSQEMEFGRILSILWNGDVLPYTPGFATVKGEDVRRFVIGNLLAGPLSRCVDGSVYAFLQKATKDLLSDCEMFCGYFEVCGGGSPAHRWSEAGNFDHHLTRTCRASVQARFEGIVSGMLAAAHEAQPGT